MNQLCTVNSKLVMKPTETGGWRSAVDENIRHQKDLMIAKVC